MDSSMHLKKQQQLFGRTKMSKIRNCPCCDGEAIMTQATLMFTSPGDIKEKIQCTQCGLSLEADYGEAVDRWNKRVPECRDSLINAFK